MFVALESVESGYSGIFGGILNILTKPKARLEAREALGSVYGVISAPKPTRASDWRRIAELAGRYGDRLLLPPGLSAPPPLSEPDFPRFERLVLLKTAIEIVKRTRMPMYRRIAGLVDENGEYADYLFPLLHHYTSVKALTRRTELYLDEAGRIMEELGAPVTLAEDYSSLSDCVLIIAPDGVCREGKPTCPVLAKKSASAGRNGLFITDLEVAPPPGLCCPAGIEPHRLLAALYEYCGAESASAPASRLLLGHRRATLDQAVLAVMQSSGIPAGLSGTF